MSSIACLCFLFAIQNNFSAQYWVRILSSLIGVAFGLSFLWGIRILSSFALKVEAMGFGDVIMLGMIGAFLGWQGALLSVVFALPIGILSSLVLEKLESRHFAFGPAIGAGAIVTVLIWPFIRAPFLYHLEKIVSEFGWLEILTIFAFFSFLLFVSLFVLSKTLLRNRFN